MFECLNERCLMLNESIRYQEDELFIDGVPAADIAENCGTPVYVYSLRRILVNFQQVKSAFAPLNIHIHYSAKANSNLTVLRTLIEAGAGIDAVSAGEIFRALKAGAKPENIVFAGVGKTAEELSYAVDSGIGWFNVENVDECHYLNELAEDLQHQPVKIALRYNPEVTANTHPYIATGHGGAKFGLTAEAITSVLDNQKDYPYLDFAGIHVHIGSQLHDIDATVEAINKAITLAKPYDNITTINIGGGLPVVYKPDDDMPTFDAFAQALQPILAGYNVLLEPGRSIVADAGLILTEMLYTKQQAGQTFYIVDASMAELLRPALYQAHHEIIPVKFSNGKSETVNIVGPVCETADVLRREVNISPQKPNDLLAILTTGAYGMVMANNYNARPRPAEVAVTADGENWRIIRQRETWEDLIHLEVDP